MDAGSTWEVEITDVFDIAGRDGVIVTADWVTRGEIREGDSGILLGRGSQSQVEGLGIEFHGPPDGVALFLPDRSKSDVEPGDRLTSA